MGNKRKVLGSKWCLRVMVKRVKLQKVHKKGDPNASIISVSNPSPKSQNVSKCTSSKVMKQVGKHTWNENSESIYETFKGSKLTIMWNIRATNIDTAQSINSPAPSTILGIPKHFTPKNWFSQPTIPQLKETCALDS